MLPHLKMAVAMVTINNVWARMAGVPSLHLILFTMCILSSVYSTITIAHDPGLSLIDIEKTDNKFSVHITYAKADIEQFITLDRNKRDGISKPEFNQAKTELEQFIIKAVQFRNGENRIRAIITDIKMDKSDAIHFIIQLASVIESGLTIHSAMIAQFSLGHRQFVTVKNAQGLISSQILSARNAVHTFDLPRADLWGVFNNFVQEGVWHIWIGFDHILFVITLLLPAVLVLKKRHWYPEKQFTQVFKQTLKVISAFTIAHSLTLALTVFNVIALPGKTVESIIAISVIVAACNNIFNWVNGRLWLMAFVFGLIHGMGFAAVLNDLGMQINTQALALIAFNLGVELGQLAIIMAVLPLLYAVRKQEFYKPVLMQRGSYVIALIATIWLFERISEVSII